MGGGDNELIIKTILDNTGFAKGSKQLMSAIKGLTNSIKSLFGRVVGVASIFGIISKAVSTFMSQNQALTKQMNAAWTALGNALGPIITQIVGLVTKAVSYLVTFMKLLGFTSKTASQASKAAQGAAGGLQRTIAGFDELNKLSSGGGGGAGTLNDVDPDVFMEKLAELLKSRLWEEAGRLLADKVNSIIKNIDFAGIAKKLSDGLKGILEFLIGFIDQLDFQQIGAKIRDFFTSIDWEGIRDRIFELLKAAWNGALELLWGLMNGESEEEPPLVGALRSLGDSISKFAETVEPIIDKVWNEFLKPFADWLAETVLPDAIQTISDRISDLADLLNGDMSFADFIDNMTLAEGAATAFATAFGLIKLGSFITDVKTLASSSVLGKLAEVLTLTASGAGTLGESIVTVFPSVGKAISSLKTGLGAVGGAFAKLFSFLAANPFVIIIAAIVGLVAYLVHLYKTNEEFREKVDAAWAAVKEAIGNAVEVIKEKWEAFKEAIGNLKEKFSEFKEKVAEKWDALKEKLNPDAIKDKVVTAFSEMKDSVSEKWDGIKEKTSSVWDNITGKVSEKIGAVKDDVSQRMSGIFGAISDTWNNSDLTVGQKVFSIAGTIRGAFSDIVQNVSRSMVNVIDSIIPGFADIAGKISDTMKNIWTTVSSAFSDIIRNAWSWGSDLIHNLWDGISSQLSSFFDGIKNIAQGIRDFLGFSEPKKGPLSDFHTYGPDMMELYASGIQSESAKVYSAVNDVAEGVADGLAQSPMALSAVASGSVVPYGVTGGVEASAAPNDGVSLTEVRDILTEIRNLLGTMEFVAQFGDLRAVAQRITTIQKQMERARG